MKLLLAMVAGVVFGVGLGVSGMTQPTKVVGFLDVAGAWDPSLAFVMMGAIGVHAVGVRMAKKRGAPLFGGSFAWPSATDIDATLVLGAALFGVGWGLGGFCPGPALVGASSGNLGAVAFVGAMTAGMIGRHATKRS